MPSAVSCTLVALLIFNWFVSKPFFVPYGYYRFCVECVAALFAPAIFILTGSYTAPRFHFVVSVVLCTLCIGLDVVLVVANFFLERLDVPLWRVVVGGVLSIFGCIVASHVVAEDERIERRYSKSEDP